jgi:hypothetical protein
MVKGWEMEEQNNVLVTGLLAGCIGGKRLSVWVEVVFGRRLYAEILSVLVKILKLILGVAARQA